MIGSNEVRELLEADDVPLGAAAITGSPAVVELLGEMGHDFVWLDLEHGAGSPYNARTTERRARAADAAGTELLVRVPSPDPAVIRKVLDTGVRNVLVPRVETAAEVRRAVEAGYFAYDGDVGERGFSLARANQYGEDMAGYATAEDDAVLVGAMIENERAVRNVEEILSVPSLGFVFVGPSDLSVSAGHAGNPGHPDVQEQIDRVLDAAAEAGVPVAGIVLGEAEPRAMIDRGYRMLAVGSDVGAIRRDLSPTVERDEPS
jgi:2-dehydro-3-deoxyglucarate aldolase